MKFRAKDLIPQGRNKRFFFCKQKPKLAQYWKTHKKTLSREGKKLFLWVI